MDRVISVIVDEVSQKEKVRALRKKFGTAVSTTLHLLQTNKKDLKDSVEASYPLRPVIWS